MVRQYKGSPKLQIQKEYNTIIMYIYGSRIISTIGIKRERLPVDVPDKSIYMKKIVWKMEKVITFHDCTQIKLNNFLVNVGLETSTL